MPRIREIAPRHKSNRDARQAARTSQKISRNELLHWKVLLTGMLERVEASLNGEPRLSIETATFVPVVAAVVDPPQAPFDDTTAARLRAEGWLVSAPGLEEYPVIQKQKDGTWAPVPE